MLARLPLLAVAAVSAAACSDATVGGLPEAPRCPIDAPAAGGLTIADGVLVDVLGRRVTLRGVNAGGRSKFAPYSPFDYADDGYDAALAAYLDRAAAWGINLLRVPFSWQAFEPQPGAVDTAQLLRYDALVDAAWARGMWTIIDFHQDVYAEPLCGDGFPSWTLPEAGPPQHDCADWFTRYNDADVRAAFDRFWADDGGVQTSYRNLWRWLADRHAGRPGVIGYEPINEPHPGTADADAWAQTTLTTFYSDLATLIAEHDGDALIFVDTTGLDGVLGDTELQRPAGDRIVLAPHAYQPGALFGGGVDPDVTGRLAPWAELGAAWQVPVLMGEMGIVADHPDAAAYLRWHLDALDQLGLHGTWWEYSASAELWNGENLSVVDPTGADTVLVAELARPYLAAVAGDVNALTWDADARVFTAAWTPTSDAPAEIRIPAGAAPAIGAEGACVDVSAGRVLVRPSGPTASVAVALP